MDFRDSPADAAFRKEVRDFLDRELPAREGGTPSPGGLGTGGEKDRG